MFRKLYDRPCVNPKLTTTFIFLTRNSCRLVRERIRVFVDSPLPVGIKVFGLGRPTERNLLREINLFRSFIETLHNLDYRSH